MSKLVFALATISFLTITLSGFHLHADVGGHDASASHAHDLHLHLHLTLDHDLHHDAGHVDVSVFEPASGSSKTEVFAPLASIPELAVCTIIELQRSFDMPVPVDRPKLRLRPLLRAPPVSS